VVCHHWWLVDHIRASTPRTTTNDRDIRTIHFSVSSRQASKPNPERRQVDKNILMQIAINVQHYELRHLAQYVKPNDIVAGWAALGFDPINPRYRR